VLLDKEYNIAMISIPPKLISNAINEGKTSNNFLFAKKQIRHQYPCNTEKVLHINNRGENGRNFLFKCS